MLHRRSAVLYQHVLALPVLAVAFAAPSLGAEPKPIPPEQFDQLHKQIKPQEGESLFWQVPWLLSLDEALLKGAKEGKPIFVWSGAGGSPHTVC